MAFQEKIDLQNLRVSCDFYYLVERSAHLIKWWRVEGHLALHYFFTSFHQFG